ncbi:MAG: methylenetetrahydrofolate--tRNA-(uracil(54)-C(5))-methyltransferase (FADH(2)-oxidizing) TrmFO [Alphaproteobacteria bacterium]
MINIIGAGLAGCEAAWQIANRGKKVKLHEMKPKNFSPAHKNKDFAELVCSNSFRSSDSEYNAVGLLQQELRELGSLIIEAADKNKVPAGGALAVNREEFSAYITKKIKSHPLIEVIEEEITTLPNKRTIIATGPLTSEALSQDILKNIDGNALNFYDAIAPIVFTESIDFTKAWYQSRYDKGDAKDYINLPMTKEEYYNFIEELLNAQKVEFKDFEKPDFFDGCLPIEVMAERGLETLRFGPLKPVGLTSPYMDEKPYAIIQLRMENKEDTMRNIVGFQTKLTYPEQKRIFKMIPGLENAEFAKLGSIHKNTFINSPKLLDSYLRLKTMPHISFAGQITGCEGYIESTAIGFLAGIFEFFEDIPPQSTSIGALLKHVTDSESPDFQPSNINFGLFSEITTEKKIKGRDKKNLLTIRAKEDIAPFINKIKL